MDPIHLREIHRWILGSLTRTWQCWHGPELPMRGPLSGLNPCRIRPAFHPLVSVQRIHPQALDTLFSILFHTDLVQWVWQSQSLLYKITFEIEKDSCFNFVPLTFWQRHHWKILISKLCYALIKLYFLPGTYLLFIYSKMSSIHSYS